MESAMLRSFVTVDSAPANVGSVSLQEPSAPAKAVPRTYPAVPQRDASIELQRVQRPATHNSTSGIANPVDLPDLEMSRPGTPLAQSPSEPDGVDVVQSVWHPYMNRFRFLSVCFMNFGNGMNDSAPGALIPYMEKHYNIGYGTVSLIFVGNALGFITAALIIDALKQRLGRAKTLALAQTVIALGYLPVVLAAPFIVIVCSFFMVGIGMSINIALGNTFCGGLRNGTSLLGGMHGAYGIGATIGPLIATAMVTLAGASWSRYYLLTLGITVLNAVFAIWSFRGYETDAPDSSPAAAPLSRNVSGMFTALSSRIVLLGALFIFAYQGAEVSISGWVISFLLSSGRAGDPSNASAVGYVTAGFWGGITLGRFLLTGPAHRLGERRAVYGLVAGAAAFELLVWWVPNLAGDAVSVSVVGLLLGPVYPCAAAVFMRGLGRDEQVASLGVISAVGSSGGAAAPFTTGMLAQAVGTFVLHPVAVGLFAVMVLCWWGLPEHRKRSE